MHTELQDGKYKFWDITIKAVSSLLGIATIAIALISYLGNQKAELLQKEREYRKELATRQINYYSEISHSMGELITLLDKSDSLFTASYFVKKREYTTLYYGKMNLIESRKVDSCLEYFSRQLERYEADDPRITKHDLMIAVFDANNAFRKSIRDTYDVKLDNLTK